MDSQLRFNSLKETQNKYMNDQDLTANVVSLGGIVMTLAQFQTILTIAVLVTGLILNVVRIYETRKNRKK
jgi:divalent metal cation (Fe/Co/Zn/Cd) transporter